MTTIAVTELEFRKAESIFTSTVDAALSCLPVPADEKSLAEAVRSTGARHVIIGVERYAGPLYESLPAGGVIARFGVGHDGVDKSLATEKRLLCTNTPGALDDSVAEHAVNLLLAATRHTVNVAADLRDGRWSPQVGCELQGKTLAIIGCGAIGRRVARIAVHGLRMKAVGCEVLDVNVEQLKRECGFASVVKAFEDAVREADFISLHIPSLPETRHFLSTNRLAQLPSRCWVVNTARGALVDEVALFDVLGARKIAGAALDVFEREPYEPAVAGKDLRTLPNVVLTPHVGSSTREACGRMARRALDNIRLAEASRFAEMDLLNRKVLTMLDGMKRTQS